MKITKNFLEEVFEETVKKYRMFVNVPVIKLKFIDKEKFMESVKENPLIQTLIKRGIYKNLDKEYSSFLVVYSWDKNPINYLINGCYNISCCLDIAKEKLKPFKPNEVRGYLKYLFAHEITHVIEESVFKDQLDSLAKTYGKELAGEILANEMADKIISDKKDYQKIDDYLNAVIKNRIKKIERR